MVERWSTMHQTAFRLTLVVIGVLALSNRAFGAQTDTLVLSSGNRVTGSVSGLSRGELSFDIDGAGEVAIDWKNVESLESPRKLDVDLRSGERVSGTIRSPQPGQLEVRT